MSSTATATIEQEIAALPAAEREPARAFFAENPPGAGTPVAIVIPAYNEEPTVAEVVRRIPKEIAGRATEVIVVNDGSTDRTVAEARAAGALVCDIPVNRGQGLIFKLGYWLAARRGAEVIATTDADAQYNESELVRLVEPILSGRVDFVNGSRRLGTELTTDPVRHAGVVFFGSLISLLLLQKITDPASGIRAFRTTVPMTVKLQQSQYQTSEMLVAARFNGFRIAEAPTTMRDRPEGATRTKKGPNLLYGMRFARAILVTWRREAAASLTRRRSANT